jgi:DNA topoisomerase-1
VLFVDLIISEKAIAGERIAELLGNGKPQQKNIDGAKAFFFDWNGKGAVVLPLRGHISDVEFPSKYNQWRGTDVRELIRAPIEYSETEKTIILGIRKAAEGADRIIIATDADREGESIGLEAITYAQQTNPKIKIERAYFSAITKPDIEKSFNNLEKFDFNFAHSADARREIDLIWGSVLTRFISLISGNSGKGFLSVGRVQTPTLALIVDREKERIAFDKKKYWEIILFCEKDSTEFQAMHKEEKFWEKEKALTVLNKNPQEAEVKSITKKMKIIKKPVPFNTTEFLRAATAIGFSAEKAMNIAESLYQRGFTSYPRTDNSCYPKNLDLMEILLKIAKVPELKESADKILKKGKLEPSQGKETKDHPPVHPVEAANKNALSYDEWKIYELICRRFLATLADDAETENTTVLLEAEKELFVANGQIILKAGWKEHYHYSKLSENILPKLEQGDFVKIKKIDMLEKETQPKPRYSQGSLLKLMEENNLGTKSTRPAIIQKLYSRNYITGQKSIEPSNVAFAVIDSLEKHCDIITKPEMTANTEKEMDEIAAGKKTKATVVDDSRTALELVMKKLFENKDAVGKDIWTAMKNNLIIGNCNKCGKGQIVGRKGKTGKRFAGCSTYPQCNNSFPLPQKGNIRGLGTYCPDCQAPEIELTLMKRKYKMCINMNCKTKDEWKKKAEEKKIKLAQEIKEKNEKLKEKANVNATTIGSSTSNSLTATTSPTEKKPRKKTAKEKKE